MLYLRQNCAPFNPTQLQVSLRFRAEERCHFLREETREVEDESALDPLLRDFGPM